MDLVVHDGLDELFEQYDDEKSGGEQGEEVFVRLGEVEREYMMFPIIGTYFFLSER